MRLARSFCEGLVLGFPRGFWPPEIMPDMLWGTGQWDLGHTTPSLQDIITQLPRLLLPRESG